MDITIFAGGGKRNEYQKSDLWIADLSCGIINKKVLEVERGNY